MGKVTDNNFTAGDVMRLTGLSYRQLNDWEGRGKVFNSDRGTSEGWRKFTFNETFALSICSVLKKRLSLRLSMVASLHRWLLLPGLLPADIAKSAPFIADDLRMQSKGRLQVARTIQEYGGNLGFEKMICAALLKESSPVQRAIELVEAGAIMYLLTDFTESMVLPDSAAFRALTWHQLGMPLVVCELNPILKNIASLEAKSSNPDSNPAEMPNAASIPTGEILSEKTSHCKNPQMRNVEHENINYKNDRAKAPDSLFETVPQAAPQTTRGETDPLCTDDESHPASVRNEQDGGIGPKRRENPQRRRSKGQEATSVKRRAEAHAPPQ